MISVNNDSQPVQDQILNQLQEQSSLQPYQQVGLWRVLYILNSNESDYIERAYQVSRDCFNCSEHHDFFSIRQSGLYLRNIQAIRAACCNLLDLSGIDKTEEIYGRTSKYFKIILKDMIRDAICHIGDVPFKCTFSVIGLGSLAREEMTPYSDFEYAVITNVRLNDEQKQYFINLAEHLHHQILHLGETPLRELETPYFFSEEPIKKGFSLDGPLGKMAPNWDARLIGTPSELASFQQEKFFKERRIFPNELRYFTYLYGDEGLSDAYQQEISKSLNEIQRQGRALALLDADLSRFDMRFGKVEELQRVYTIKYEAYRLLQLLVEGLSLYFDVKEKSIWSRIRSLRQYCLSKEGENNLLTIANLVLHLRLDCYLKNHEAIESIPESDWDREKWKEVYRTLIPFSSAVDRFLDTKDISHIQNNEFKVSDEYVDASYFQFTNQDEEACEIFEKIFKQTPEENKLLRADLLNRIGNCSFSFDKEKSKKCFRCVLDISNSANDDPLYLPILKSKMAATNNLGAYCRFICRFDLALKYFKEARSCVDQRFFHRMFERFSIYSNLGVVYATLKDFIEAKIYQRLALYIQEASEAKHRNTALASYNLGETLFRLGEYDEAMKLFDATEKIAKNICGSFHCLCGEAYKGRGLIFFERALKAYRQDKKKILNQSIEYHKKALEIFQRDLGEDSDELITSLCNLGVSSAFVDFQSSETYFNLAKAKILLKDPERKRVRYWKDFYSQKALACKEANRIEEARKYYYLSLDTWMKHLEPLSEAAKKQCRFETAFRLNNYEMILKHLAKLAPNRKKAYELEFALSLNFCKTHKLVFQDKDSDETKN